MNTLISRIPNFVTILSAFLGILSIMYSIDGDFKFAIICIFTAIILDGLDGSLARFLHSESKSGKHLDSISDMISFCFAPAYLLYSKYYDLSKGTSFQSVDNLFVVIVSSLLIICGIYRLTRFLETDKTDFEGLPTPAFALFILLILIAFQYIYTVLIMAFIGSFLMIVRVEYPKFEGWIKIVIGSVLIIEIIGFFMDILLISILSLMFVSIYVFEPILFSGLNKK